MTLWLISRYFQIFLDISLIFHWYPIFLWLYQKSQQAMAGAMCAMCAMPCVPWPSGWSLAPRTTRPAGRSDPSNSPANSCVVTWVTCVVTNGRILRWSKRSKRSKFPSKHGAFGSNMSNMSKKTWREYPQMVHHGSPWRWNMLSNRTSCGRFRDCGMAIKWNWMELACRQLIVGENWDKKIDCL